MAITSVLFYVVARSRWNWSLTHIGVLTVAFLFVDVSLLCANAIKFEHGGWVPVAIAIAVFTLMSTWKKGRLMLNEVMHAGSLPLSLFLDDVERRKPPRVTGTAVFMTSSAEGVPVVLLHHLKHNKVLHEQVVLMSILTEEFPEVEDDTRVSVERLEQGFYRVTARYGFMETPDVPEVLSIAKAQDLPGLCVRLDATDVSTATLTHKRLRDFVDAAALLCRSARPCRISGPHLFAL